jgi:excisionase family DNA binding protein
MSRARIDPTRYSASSEAGSLTIPRLVTLKELAYLLSISARSLARFVAEKGLPCYRLGRAVRFNPEEVSAWLETRKV